MSTFNINAEGSNSIRQSYGLNNSANANLPEATQNSGGRTTYGRYILPNTLDLPAIKTNNTLSKDNYVNSVRTTLTPQAIRNDKFDLFTGKFDDGYPFNRVYYFCDQNLTSIFKYSALHYSRSSEIGHYPTSTSISTVNGSVISALCSTPPICNVTCPPGQSLDPSSCRCVTPEECIPQPSCSPIPILQNFKPLIKGYAFYVDSKREVTIPDIGTVTATCWGGHACCFTDFLPTLIKQDGSKILATRPISMNNLSSQSVGCPDTQINIAGFIRNTPYERSDTFKFILDDPSVINSNTNFYLDCDGLYCHNGVTMVCLVAETVDNESVLIFNSCVTPSQLDSKPLGTIDCDTESESSLCEPPPPPPPPPPCDPVCTGVFFSVSTGAGNCINPPQYGEQTINVPPGLSLPVYVTMIGTSNDLLCINGQPVEAGQHPTTGSAECFVEAGNYSFILNESSFTISSADTMGSGTGYDYEICMTECLPTSPLSSGQSIGVFNFE